MFGLDISSVVFVLLYFFLAFQLSSYPIGSHSSHWTFAWEWNTYLIRFFFFNTVLRAISIFENNNFDDSYDRWHHSKSSVLTKLVAFCISNFNFFFFFWRKLMHSCRSKPQCCRWRTILISNRVSIEWSHRFSVHWTCTYFISTQWN